MTTSNIKLKKSSIAGRVPAVGDLDYGELALNYADGILYYKKSDGTTIGSITTGSGSGGSSGTVTSVALLGGTTGLTTSGGPITTAGTITLAGTLSSTNGGTGLTSPGAVGNVLTSDGTNWLSSPASGGGGAITVATSIDVSSSSAALRVTQRGSGASILVEDSPNPDSSPFIVTATGFVGIGTSYPQSALQIKQAGDSVIRLTTNNTDTFIQSIYGEASIGTLTTTPIVFYTNAYVSTSPVLVLDITGNVGVNTTSPTSPLTVVGIIESTTGGIKFPDGTIQTTASTGSGGSGTAIVISATAPSAPTAGQEWEDTTTGIKYTWSGSQWVELGPQSVLSNTTVTPGVYSAANITVDQQGRITNASNGSAVGVPQVLDDISGYFDSVQSTFSIALNQVAVTTVVDNKDLEVVVNGLRIQPYIEQITYPWLTPCDFAKGFKVRSNGTVTIPNAPAVGDQAFIVHRPASVVKQQKKYPYSAMTITLGD